MIEYFIYKEILCDGSSRFPVISSDMAKKYEQSLEKNPDIKDYEIVNRVDDFDKAVVLSQSEEIDF